MRLVPVRIGTCPWCKCRVYIARTLDPRSAVQCVIHEMPVCNAYLRLDSDSYSFAVKWKPLNA